MTIATLEAPLLTYAEAAVRVRRTVREVNRWRADGMPMTSGIRDGQIVRLVREDVLLAWWRDRLRASPVEYYRRRKRAAEAGRPAPTPPPSVVRAPRPEIPATVDEVDETAQAERSVDWASIAMLRRGEAEWAALSQGLQETRPACEGVPGFIADRYSVSEAHRLAETCSRCPVLSLCAAFAEASRPTSGFWAGSGRR